MFSNVEVCFNLCVTHAAHSQSHANFLVSYYLTVVCPKLELRSFPITFSLCWLVAHQDTKRKAVLTKGPRTQAPSAITAIQSKHSGSKEPNLLFFWAAATTVCFEFIHRTLSPLAIFSIIQPGHEILLYLKLIYRILYKFILYSRKI